MVRIKHRYLLLNILYPDASNAINPKPSVPVHIQFQAPTPSHITPPLLLTALRNSISTHFGDLGLGLTTSSLKVIYFSTTTSTAIVRCRRAHHRIVWAALTYLSEMPGVRRGERGRECVVQVVRVSGTIRKSEEELMRRARAEILRAKEDDSILAAGVLGKAMGVTATMGGRDVESSIMDYDDEDEEVEDESD